MWEAKKRDKLINIGMYMNISKEIDINIEI